MSATKNRMITMLLESHSDRIFVLKKHPNIIICEDSRTILSTHASLPRRNYGSEDDD